MRRSAARPSVLSSRFLSLASSFGCFLLFLVLVPVSVRCQERNTSLEKPHIPLAQNQIIKLTDQGLLPQRLQMKVEDSILFFLNSSQDSLATIEVEFLGKATHCSSSNLQIAPDHEVRSQRPIGPRDFATVCFHDRGTYLYRVHGLNGKEFTGTIEVE